MRTDEMQNEICARDPTEERSGPVRLRDFQNATFNRGRSRLTELLWLFVQSILVSSAIPGSTHRCFILRKFGARIGRGVVIKPRVRIKFPWRLSIGDDSWIGEAVWIDNLGQVDIGANCCLSQEVYLCTGSHDWGKAQFDLVVRPIVIEDGAWIAARATLAPGTRVGEGAVLGLGGVATSDLEAWTIYQAALAMRVKKRQISEIN